MDGSHVIQFVHFSVKVYLTLERLAQAKDAISRFHLFFLFLSDPLSCASGIGASCSISIHLFMTSAQAHIYMAQACLGAPLHINDDITEDGSKKSALAKYVAELWVSHARFDGVSLFILDGLKRLFDPNNHHLVWVWIYDSASPRCRYNCSTSPSPLLAVFPP